MRHPTEPAPASVWDSPPRAVWHRSSANYVGGSGPVDLLRFCPRRRSPSSSPTSRARRSCCSVSDTTSTSLSSPSTTPSFGPVSPRTTARRSARKETASSPCSPRRAPVYRPPSSCSGRFHPTVGQEASRCGCGWASTRARPKRRRPVSSDSRFIAPPGWRPSVTVARSFARQPQPPYCATPFLPAGSSAISVFIA